MHPDRPAPGIRRVGKNWQVYTRTGGTFRSKVYPGDTPLGILRGHLSDLLYHARRQRNAQKPAQSGSLAGDMDRYLAARASMPSYKDRAFHIDQWLDALGAHTLRSAVTSVQIRSVLEAWRRGGLSHGSLNRRRTALMNFFSVMDPAAPNPVKAVPNYRETRRAWNLPERATILRVIAAVGRTRSDSTRELRKGQRTRARLLVLLWTGWPAEQLMRMKADDVNWKAGRALVRGRKKGTGSRDVVLPLLPQALAALKQLRAVEGFGRFSTSGMHSTVARQCAKLKIPTWHPYLLRHRFLTDVAAVTKDDRIVALLGLHTNQAQTDRYTTQSVDARMAEALAAFGKAID